MESQIRLEKIKQSHLKKNTLESKAEGSIRRHQVKDFINAGSRASALNILENDENSQLAAHLLHLKTSCSGMKSEIKHRELEQFRYKDETSFISSKVKSIENEKNKLEAQITKLQNVVEEVKSKEVNAVVCFKSYEHILDRMKKDEIRYQIKKNELERELKNLQKNHTNLRNKNYQLKEFGYMSAHGLKEAHEQIEKLKKFRMTTLDNMSRVVDENEVLGQKKQARKDKSDMIKEMAAGDMQDADLIRLKKFLSVQMFFKTMLKGKIEKLKDFYEPYELAFLKIKGNTNVKDAASLKAEYHNFQASYNEKAAWVKHLEDDLSKNEDILKSLKKDMSELKLKEMEILQKIEQDNQYEETPIPKDLQERAENSQVLMMSVREWLKQQAKKMRVDTSGKSQGQILKEICDILKKVQAPKEEDTEPKQ